MCGIIGYTGRKQAAPILLEGLATLEYRGYDSAGIGVVTPEGRARLDKKAGKLANLRLSLNGDLPEGSTGVGHTRWATHGGPTDSNAHPHTGSGGEVVAVHNGIVENYRDLRSELESAGHEFFVADRLGVHPAPDRGFPRARPLPGRGGAHGGGQAERRKRGGGVFDAGA